VTLKITTQGVERNLVVPNGVTFEDATDAFLIEHKLESLRSKKGTIIEKLISQATHTPIINSHKLISVLFLTPPRSKATAFSSELVNKGLNPDDYTVMTEHTRVLNHFVSDVSHS